MNPTDTPNFVILAVLDGWGIAPHNPGNAISLAHPMNISKYWASFPHTQLLASEESVGLPHGEAGNTETGHLNLGAGRIIYQDLARINMAIAEGSFFNNPTLLGAIDHARKNNSNLHLMGLIGAGGVHSNIEHLFALIELAKKQNFKNVFFHLFTDGRDSPPSSAKTFIARIKDVSQKSGIGQIASVMGRYWAMDRDQRWDRTAKAYFALTLGQGKMVNSAEEAIDISYEAGATDEFVEPSVIKGEQGKPVGIIKAGDSVIFFNFRIDRPRQLARSFVFEDFGQANVGFGFDPYLVKYQKKHTLEEPEHPVLQNPFKRGEKLKDLYFVTMTEYEKSLSQNGAYIAFPPEKVDVPIGRAIADAGFRQLRASESEKERFVTFYFNGLQEIPFDGEERLIIPSPKVPTYDLKPEMSASELTTALLEKMKISEYKFILVNFANADMVAHTGNIGAAVTACRVVDECIGKLGRWVTAFGGTLILTADHGNAEEMINSHTGQIDTEHNNNPVPFIVISKNIIGNSQMLQGGILADVAPTVLSILGISPPGSMTGRNLVEGIWKP